MPAFAHNTKLELIWDDPLGDQSRRYIFGGQTYVQLSKPVTLKTPIGTPLISGFSVPIRWSGTPNYIMISRLYSFVTGKTLPGSLKTKRLRKKRNKALNNWLTRR